MRVVSLLLVVGLLTACGESSPGASESGIRGRAVVGGDAVPSSRSIDVRLGPVLVTTIKPGQGGRFELKLAPGRYVLRSSVQVGSLPALPPTVVTVRPDEMTDVVLRFISNIR
jgi:hypothetical protein